MSRFSLQPSPVSARSVYVLDHTIPCECEGRHNATPGQGDCAKVLHVLEAGPAARAYVRGLNREPA